MVVVASRKRWGVIFCLAAAGMLAVWASCSACRKSLRRFGRTTTGMRSQGAALDAWSAAVSTFFMGITEDVGWGVRTGGVIVAGDAAEMCGVQFEGNPLRGTQEMSGVIFEADAPMVAGGDNTCKKELESAVNGGWHQGQAFYYRLDVDRPGHYTVRLTVVLYNNDGRRADGIVLSLSDLFQVRLQCVDSGGRIVVPIRKIHAAHENSMGVVEFDTVALGGEILLEIEGIYTCIGLSLVEIFYHEKREVLRVPEIVGASAGEGRSGRESFDVDVDYAGRARDDTDRPDLEALETAWKRAGPVCARKYVEEVKLRASHQRESYSRRTLDEQKYFDEWARRERLEESSGRYCKPHSAPRFGEQGWTWAGHSERIQREQEAMRAAEQQERDDELRRAGDPVLKVIFQVAVEAARREGVSPGTATALAAEAVDRAMKETNGTPLSASAIKQTIERVSLASKALVSARSRQSRSSEPRRAVTVPAVGEVEGKGGLETAASGSGHPQGASGGVHVGGSEKAVGDRMGEGRVERLITTRKGSVAVGRIKPANKYPSRRRLSTSAGGRELKMSAQDKARKIGKDVDTRDAFSSEDGSNARGHGSFRGWLDVLDVDPAVGAVRFTSNILPSKTTLRKQLDRSAPAASAATVLPSKKNLDKLLDTSAPGAENPSNGEEEGKAEQLRGWRVDPSNPMPPPACPSKLVELLEEALHAAAGKGGVTVHNGAAAATGGARSRVVMGSFDRWLRDTQGYSIPTWLKWASPGEGGGVSVQRQLVLRSLESGFQAIAAYRAHDTKYGIGTERRGDAPTKGGIVSLPLRLTGFTWDGVTVVAKETVPGCARIAQAMVPTLAPNHGWTFSEVLSDDDGGFFEKSGIDDYHGLGTYRNSGVEGQRDEGEDRGGGRNKEEDEKGYGNRDGENGREEMEDGAGRGKGSCLRLEAAMLPTVATVVDMIVPVSSGLVPRLLTLLPQMERLAKGASCNPFPPSHPHAPQCVESDNYPPAFWPERLTRQRQAQTQGMPPSLSLYSSSASYQEATLASGAMKNESRRLRGGAGERKGSWRRNGSNFRVVVSSDDPRVEPLLADYDVDTVFVQSSAPFSKAQAIQDASQVIPDDHILLVHDADLVPPCGLPDALRQTVIRGVQAVNFLLAYENQPEVGRCMYPLSTFGPMAMYASDFRNVGGIADANNGRWGYEDTAFLHKVMLGDKALGVLRVHLPGLIHRWHEVTPWKCMVWTWGGRPSTEVDVTSS